MPLTDKGEKIKSNMQNEYGDKKGESVFYASKNKGTISGVDEEPDAAVMAECDARFDSLRDRLHGLSRRVDAALDDDRSTEGHATAASQLAAAAKTADPTVAGALKSGAAFHKAEAGQDDDDCT